jgi:hypothetical protein
LEVVGQRRRLLTQVKEEPADVDQSTQTAGAEANEIACTLAARF